MGQSNEPSVNGVTIPTPASVAADTVDRSAAAFEKYGVTNVLLGFLLLVVVVSGLAMYDAIEKNREDHRQTIDHLRSDYKDVITSLRSDRKDAMAHGEAAVGSLQSSLGGLRDEVKDQGRTNAQQMQELINLHRRAFGMAPKAFNGPNPPDSP